jgi:hypothetical protein
MSQGMERHRVDNWVKSGKLFAVAQGVFKRPETELTWQSVVSSLERMKKLLFPGGLTALALQGMVHYLSPKEQKTIHLYGNDELPAWVNKLIPETVFVRRKDLDLDSNNDLDLGFHLIPWKPHYWLYGSDTLRMSISSPELAILQVLLDVPQRVSFEHASQLLKGLPTLSPHKLNRLLGHCSNIKVKRLFLWIAEKNQSPWLKKIDLEKFSMESGALGSGKRMLTKGGKLDPKYLITVPADMQRVPYGQE